MTPRLLTEQQLEFLSLTGGCTGSSESTLVKMPNCWKSHVTAQVYCITMVTRKLKLESMHHIMILGQMDDFSPRDPCLNVVLLTLR